MDKIKNQVSLILQSIGVQPNYRGYQYTLYCVIKALEDPYSLTSITKVLYPDVAKQFNTSWESVERGIRTVISKAWEINKDKIIEISSNTINEKPKPAQFIGILMGYYERNN